MAQALAREKDLISDNSWTVSSLRDYMLTLINANDRHYVEELRNLRDLMDRRIDAADKRYAERFDAQTDSIRTWRETSQGLSVTKEKAIYEAIGAATALSVSREKSVDDVLSGMLDKTRAIRVEVQNGVDHRFAGVDLALAGLKEASHLEISNVREMISQALASTERAVNKAEVANERRFDSVNEFRNTLGDQQRTLMPRSEVEVIMRGQNDKMEGLSAIIKSQNERIIALSASMSGTRKGKNDGWAMAVGIAGLTLTILSIISFFIVFSRGALPVGH